MRRLRQPVKQTFASEPGQGELVFNFEVVAPLNEARLNRGDDVLRPITLHRTTVST